MPHPISSLGAVHTVVSLLTVAAGLYSFARYQMIDGTTRSAKIYLAGMVASVFTSFGLSSTHGFNIGHALGIVALLATLGGVFIPRIKVLGRARLSLSQFAFTFSFFLLLVPGINETLTRLPVGHPLANGPESLIVRGSLAAWLGIFVLGSTFQFLWLLSCRSRT
ncbi:hypothetical protein [Paraburkholderia silvatlantica]|uniref:DUF2306 domain-containing protein n=1 Tax=Paraburkholderia silvatlantica TaxID=321895 RepID=A0ABR6FLK1_9BURK|nr:hypothetical protein [Paraburkholderia silvatlantica]MBB2927913.1 hypothetical protein [Paraburkholderia silvatlantica]PVY27524.1 hypothetical protein C7411_11977 [Paraburkholderia silvatlantica]PXW34497.1 hypothetical protein C7413_11877 [Paraburkholderia silvatlantica]